ncbi:MAG: S8 family peptidase [Phaeodactylibacter sp.]|nr:S8 family peptidase [Phaeodactylibacter sp.]
MIYPLAFVAAVGSLALWFYFQTDEARSRLFRRSFFATLAIFILSVMVADVSWSSKMGTLFRDLLVMAGFGVAFQFLSGWKRWPIYGLVLAGAILIGYYQVFMSGSLDRQQAATGPLDDAGELLVELAEGANGDGLLAVKKKYKLEYRRTFDPASPESTELDDYILVDVPSQYSDRIDEVIRAIQDAKDVDWVEPNEIITISPIEGQITRLPDKELGLNDQYVGQLWGFQAMEVKKLLDYLDAQKLTPKRKALIAILDTGIDANHEDIKGNYRSTKSTYDNDPKGHGTHCAGIAAAVSNNGLGVASFSRDNSFVEATSIKVLNASGMGSQRSIIDGIIQAADAGAGVISMSLGGLSSQSKERAYRQAVEYANKKGAIVVAAAGNSNRDAKGFAPAGVPGVIAVSAVDESLQRAVFSNYVSSVEMGVAAPGVNIFSTIPGNKYASFNGTSMATPYTAGLLGLMKSLDPDLNTKDAYEILKKTGLPTGNTKETGLLINPYAAVKMLASQNN